MRPPRRLRVLHLLDHVGGQFFPNIVRSLDRDVFDVYFWAVHGMTDGLRDQLESDGVRVINDGPLTPRDYPAVAGRLLHRLRRLHIDVLHTHNFHASAMGMVAGRLAGVPALVVTRHHCNETELLHKPWHRRIDQLSGRLAHLTLANSAYTMNVLVSKEHVPASKVRLLYYGIDLRPFLDVAPDSVGRLRRELGLDGRFVLAIPGRLDRFKGHRFLLEAMPEVVRTLGPDVVLLVVGAGPMREALERQVRELQLEQTVRFLGHRSDMPTVLAAADVVVVPSVIEAFGLVLVESMATGSAVVASEVGGIPEVVTDGVTGLLVPPQSAAALSQAIVRLHGDPALRARLGAQGVQEVTKRFRLDRMAADYKDVYLELTRRHVGSRRPATAPDMAYDVTASP